MIAKTISELKKIGIELNEESKKVDFIKLKHTFNFDFPNDFKNFYSSVNGYARYIGFEKHSIWSLHKIGKENTLLSGEYIKFCDTMLSCPWIGYSRKDRKIYKGFGFESEFDGNAEFVADSFIDFLNLIINDSEKLY